MISGPTGLAVISFSAFSSFLSIALRARLRCGTGWEGR